MTSFQLKWAIDKGIKIVVTIRETPIDPKWFKDQAGIEFRYRYIKVANYSSSWRFLA